jgi:hypothetical protein
MKTKLFLLMIIAFCVQCYAQEKMDFEQFVTFITEIEAPICYKTGKLPKKINKPVSDINKKITRQEALTFFSLTENDLKFNDFDYNFDEDIKYDNWVNILPYVDGKFSTKNYVAIMYSIAKFPRIGTDTSFSVLTTFTPLGSLIDKIEIRSQYTREEDWKDVVFLENNVLRIFDYKLNLENYNVKRGTYYIIDENKAQTIVEISDYKINEAGKISLTKTHPKQYLKEFVSFYRNYNKDSDDPMNEYNFEN